MRRFEQTVLATATVYGNSKKVSATLLALLLTTATPAAAQQSDQALLDEYLAEIERLITGNDLEGARDKLAEATLANLEDESLEIVNSQLRLLESLNASNQNVSNRQRDASNGKLTAQDKLAAMDLLDSLRVAMENGELERVQTFSEATPGTNSLLTAVFENYSSLKVQVSEPEPDNETDSFLATLEFTELTTKDGDTAFPALGWKTHRLRIVKSDGRWQKVHW